MTDDDLLTTPLAELDERYAELRIAQPSAESAMAASMRRFGQISPVVVAQWDGVLVLVDGFKRLAAARELELGMLTVRTLPLSSRAAVAAVYGLNRGGRGLLDLEEALVVRKLVRSLGLTQPEVGELLDRHKSWVSRRLSLVERLCKEVQDDVRVGLITPTVAREVARLPRGNQPEVAATVHKHGLTTRDAAALVTLFEQTTDRREQRGLLDDPRTALQAHGRKREEPPHDARLGTKANHIRRQALRLAEGAARLSRLLAEATVPEWLDIEREVLTAVLTRTRDAVTHLPDDVTAVLEALGSADGA
ncbi:MAG: ParB/RepB/Spo0J family partition protein [bacterium]|nr:ParB/RepB/Spo0J family partition protein [bacterium]